MDSSGPVQISKGKIIGRKWKVIKKLGEGGCGSVYKVMNLTSNPNNPEMAALKAEFNMEINVLKLEVQVLQRLEGRPHVAQLLYSGKRDNFSYIVMTLMGDSLSSLIKKVGGRVSKSTLVRVAVNVLFCLKQIHEIGFVHRDLKPANIAIGYPSSGRQHFLHILDFGLSRMFVVKRGNNLVFRRQRERALFRGTARYCSINTHEKQDQGRVDDLWSFMYMIAEMRDALPWKYVQSRSHVCQMKKSTPLSVLFKCYPEHMFQICEHLNKLDYFSRPNYHFIANQFFGIIRENNFKFTDPYDWEDGKILNHADVTIDETETVTHPSSADELREQTATEETANRTSQQNQPVST